MKNNKRTPSQKPIILIVSPPTDLQIGLQALLSSFMDVDVYVTGEGSSALAALARYSPDLVILDQDISAIPGQGIIKEINENWPDLKIIVFINNDEAKDYFSLQGVSCIITKGLPGSDLINEIKNQLK